MVGVLPFTRRLEFPGKRRLRRHVHVPTSGVAETRVRGVRLRLDLSESLHRDYFFGLCDQLELRLISRLLTTGGDFVDVGAHIGLYTVCTARQLDGRVLALEPNPQARATLRENVSLNDCANVVVEGVAASDCPGFAPLYLSEAGDSSWSTLIDGRIEAGDAIDVETTTLDLEVERNHVRPAVVKIDVEGNEIEVLRGARAVLQRRPALLVELVERNAAAAIGALGRLGYAVARIGTRRLEPWSMGVPAANALFVQPWQLDLLGRRAWRAFASGEQHVVGQRGQPRCESVEHAGDATWRPGQRGDWAEPLARDADDLEPLLLGEPAEQGRREDADVSEVGSVEQPML
jgi:FkbM family methyltransferase